MPPPRKTTFLCDDDVGCYFHQWHIKFTSPLQPRRHLHGLKAYNNRWIFEWHEIFIWWWRVTFVTFDFCSWTWCHFSRRTKASVGIDFPEVPACDLIAANFDRSVFRYLKSYFMIALHKSFCVGSFIWFKIGLRPLNSSVKSVSSDKHQIFSPKRITCNLSANFDVSAASA